MATQGNFVKSYAQGFTIILSIVVSSFDSICLFYKSYDYEKDALYTNLKKIIRSDIIAITLNY